MRILSKLVFDEHLHGSGPFHTSQTLNDLLGRYDQLAIQVVVTDANAAGSITVGIQHSADGRHFIDKNPKAEISGTGSGPGTGTIATGTVNVRTGEDPGIHPSLAHVRLKIMLVGTTRARVKIRITLRDQSSGGSMAPRRLRIRPLQNGSEPVN